MSVSDREPPTERQVKRFKKKMKNRHRKKR